MNPYKSHFELFLKHLNRYAVTLQKKQPQELYAPENYILSLGGKRVRPLLALIACDLMGTSPRKALNTALAVELFHNFSLIHDDILDQAPLRRNKTTVHMKWNTNIAILSGDVMLVKASQVLNSYPAELHKALLELLHATAIEVCEGQQMDMNFETQAEVSVQEYLHMITLKTAVLLGCSLQMGAMVAGADKKTQKSLYAFGKHLGIAFQLRDDYLDAFADNPDHFGKQAGGDIISNKKTFLLLKAFELANPAQYKQLKQLMTLDRKQGDKKIKGIKKLFEDLGVKSWCEKEADKHTNLAIKHLHSTNAAANKKEALVQFAMDLLNRQA